MTEAAEAKTRDKIGGSVWAVVNKRWRGWLRAVHRDFGYVAVGFTVIYALSGLAINHIKDWDPNFTSSEKTLKIAAMGEDLSDADAVKRVTEASGLGKPETVFRAGDEVRLTYADGTQVAAIGEQVTVQARSPRFFLRVANWLHYNRGKKAWTYVSDVYAVMLLYLAISGIFMIKGRLGFKWRGMILVGAGIAVPLAYVVWSGGPTAHQAEAPDGASQRTLESGARSAEQPDQIPVAKPAPELLPREVPGERMRPRSAPAAPSR